MCMHYKKKTFRRLLAVLLAVITVLSSLPIIAWAAVPDYPTAESDGKAYIDYVEIKDVVDGIGPFDLTDNPGMDSSDHNGIVRSFDDLAYDIEVTYRAIDEMASYHDGYLYLQCELPVDMTYARFDTGIMDFYDGYIIQYYDKDGKLIDEGVNKRPAYLASTHNTGSNAGVNSYRTDVAKQVMTCWYSLAKEGSDWSAGQQLMHFNIEVLAAPNGTVIEPEFIMWFGGNKENAGNDNGVLSDSAATTVSAKGSFDVRLAAAGAWNRWSLDRKTGNPADENTADEDKLSGRYGPSGVTLFLCGVTDNPDVAVRDKGIKGCELPTGDISYTITLTESGTNVTDDGAYKPILWDYTSNEHTGSFTTRGYFGNFTKCLDNVNTSRASWLAPSGQRETSEVNWHARDTVKFPLRSNYQNGTVYVDDMYKPQNQTDMTGRTSTFTMSVSDYGFDLDTWYFAANDYGSANTNADYLTWYKPFSSACFMSVCQYPDDRTGTVQISQVVSDLKISSVSEQIDKDSITNNNTANRTLQAFVKGTFSKDNQWIKPDVSDGDASTYYLGTDYWTYGDRDAVTFSGNRVSVRGIVNQSTNSDVTITDANILQKFDTTAFKLDLSKHTPMYNASYNGMSGHNPKWAGDVTVLYAADPMYPKGYDSNDKQCAERMSLAEEEDFVYFNSYDECLDAGYECTAILYECRNTTFVCGGSIMISVPLKASNDVQCVGKTYATTNVARFWENHAAKDYTYKDSTVINAVEGGVSDFKNDIGTMPETVWYAGNKVNKYVKVEWKDGVVVPGTDIARSHNGNAIQILGYESKIKISPDKEHYDLDKNQRTITYTLSDIRADITRAVGSNAEINADNVTDFTVDVKLDENLEYDNMSIRVGDTYVSANKYAPSVIEYEWTDKIHGTQQAEYTIWFECTEDGKLRFHLSDAIIGVNLPNITFEATIMGFLSHKTVLTSTASIRGIGDPRPCVAYLGNLSSCDCDVVALSATSIVKEVDTPLIEQGGEITYIVRYANLSKNPLDKVYFYDILPYNGDGRQSDFSGGYDVTQIKLINGDGVSLYTTDKSGSSVYNSMTDWTNFSDTFSNLLGTVSGDDYTWSNSDNTKVTGFGAEADYLGAFQELCFEVTIKTHGNKAKDVYGNTAKAWAPDAGMTTQNNAIASNLVLTRVVGRDISGFVFEDTNENGQWDDGETLIDDAVVTLLKKTDDGYISVTESVSGDKIEPVQTNDKGEYKFKNLPAGKYTVVFSGDKLNKYVGATGWRVDGTRVDINNKATDSSVDGYCYQIKVGEDNVDIVLPDIEDMVQYEYTAGNMNLGLISYDIELPDAGVSMTAELMAGIGFILMISSLFGIFVILRKEKAE